MAEWVLIAREGLFRSVQSWQCRREPENTGSQATAKGRVEMTNHQFHFVPRVTQGQSCYQPVSKTCILLISPAGIGAHFLYPVPNKNGRDLASCLHKITPRALGGYYQGTSFLSPKSLFHKSE